ncbi:MAG: hypothetical protein ACLPXB_19065 [Thiobacillaceae bacterium]
MGQDQHDVSGHRTDGTARALISAASRDASGRTSLETQVFAALARAGAGASAGLVPTGHWATARIDRAAGVTLVIQDRLL